MGRPLVTGGSGFAGRHLVALLEHQGEEVLAPPSKDVDLLDPDAVRLLVADTGPSLVCHLAAFSSNVLSWEQPLRALHNNIRMSLNVLDALRAESSPAPVVLASSSQVYGAQDELPITEAAELRPPNPYAVSKIACEQVGAGYARVYGLKVVSLRAFNHAGPGQSDDYVLGALCRQVAEAELEGRRELILRVGNVDSSRDLTDVRDVARAYVAAVHADPGVYNVCSGRSVNVRELTDLIDRYTELNLSYEVDPKRVRVGDIRELRGSAELFTRETGWEPQIPLEQTVCDALDNWRTLSQSA